MVENGKATDNRYRLPLGPSSSYRQPSLFLCFHTGGSWIDDDGTTYWKAAAGRRPPSTSQKRRAGTQRYKNNKRQLDWGATVAPLQVYILREQWLRNLWWFNEILYFLLLLLLPNKMEADPKCSYCDRQGKSIICGTWPFPQSRLACCAASLLKYTTPLHTKFLFQWRGRRI